MAAIVRVEVKSVENVEEWKEEKEDDENKRVFTVVVVEVSKRRFGEEEEDMRELVMGRTEEWVEVDSTGHMGSVKMIAEQWLRD